MGETAEFQVFAGALPRQTPEIQRLSSRSGVVSQWLYHRMGVDTQLGAIFL
jgi:hypothetical protein